MYEISFTDDAIEEVEKLEKSDSQAFKKLEKLLTELAEHPQTGTGKPKPLGANRVGQWSRHITDKHRLIYMIEDEVLTVMIISARGHYDDK